MPRATRSTAASDLVSVLDYRDDGRTVAMTRAYTVPTFRGHGYAASSWIAPSRSWSDRATVR